VFVRAEFLFVSNDSPAPYSPVNGHKNLGLKEKESQKNECDGKASLSQQLEGLALAQIAMTYSTSKIRCHWLILVQI
jgi:hypothetical protein